jgi:hypothetical protein
VLWPHEGLARGLCHLKGSLLLQAPSGLEPTLNESGLFSSETVLNTLKLIFAGAPLSEVLTIIAERSYPFRAMLGGHAFGLGLKMLSSTMRWRFHRHVGCKSDAPMTTLVLTRHFTNIHRNSKGLINYYINSQIPFPRKLEPV